MKFVGTERDNVGISDDRNISFLAKLVSGSNRPSGDHADSQESQSAGPRNRFFEVFLELQDPPIACGYIESPQKDIFPPDPRSSPL